MSDDPSPGPSTRDGTAAISLTLLRGQHLVPGLLAQGKGGNSRKATVAICFILLFSVDLYRNCFQGSCDAILSGAQHCIGSLL